MASMSSCGKRGAACFWLRWAGSRERESPRPRPRGAGSKLGALTCGRVEAVADGESIIMRNTRAIRMVARAQAEGRRVLDVCVLTFLIRGINERRVSDTRIVPPYEFASRDRPLRAHPRSVVIRNVIGLLTRPVVYVVRLLVRRGRRVVAVSGGRGARAGPAFVRTLHARGGIYRTNLHCYAYFALSAARGEAFADAPRPDDAFCTPTERRAAPRPSSHADPPLMPCA